LAAGRAARITAAFADAGTGTLALVGRRADTHGMKRLLPLLVVTATVAPALTMSAAAQTVEPSTPSAVQRAFTDWRSGLRHEDGERACSRMTSSARQAVIAAMAEEGITGLGCATILDIGGRDLWSSMKSRRLHGVVVSGTRARAITNVGSRVSFRREGGRWKLTLPAS